MIKVNGKVEGGYVAGLSKALTPLEGKDVNIRITTDKMGSDRQRNYYFAVIVEKVREAMNDYGSNYTKDDVHEFLKQEVGQLFVEMINPATGEILKFPGTTMEMTTREKEDYHEQCRAWAAENLGIVIALPNEADQAWINERLERETKGADQ